MSNRDVRTHEKHAARTVSVAGLRTSMKLRSKLGLIILYQVYHVVLLFAMALRPRMPYTARADTEMLLPSDGRKPHRRISIGTTHKLGCQYIMHKDPLTLSTCESNCRRQSHVYSWYNIRCSFFLNANHYISSV